MTLTVGSLFSGIGGLDLGLERAGMQVIWQSEIDPYACRVLAKHWPGVPNYGDIKRIQFADIVRPDVICGGYPCQPFSTAGKRQGEEDPRHLWPWVREAIRVLRPRYAILENVRGHLSLGGTTVLSEIAALGYSAEWRVISAASVGANHRRDRVFIVAYPNRQNEPDGPEHEVRMVADADGGNAADGRQREDLPSEDRSGRNDRGGSDGDPREVPLRSAGQDPGDVADGAIIGGDGREPRQRGSENGGWGTLQFETRTSGSHVADANLQRTQIPFTGVFSSIEKLECFTWWETEPDVGRVANGIPNRVDRLKGLGNAVVPQVAEVIGRLVIAHNEQQPR